MSPARWLLASLLLTAVLAASAPPASAIACDTPTNPFPAIPVGGEVGRAYGVVTGTAYGLALYGWTTTCAVAAQAINTVNAQCVFLIGRECVSLA